MFNFWKNETRTKSYLKIYCNKIKFLLKLVIYIKYKFQLIFLINCIKFIKLPILLIYIINFINLYYKFFILLTFYKIFISIIELNNKNIEKTKSKSVHGRRWCK